MPTYDYKCQVCSKALELFVKIQEKDNQSCECGGTLKQEILTAPMYDQGEAYRAVNYVKMNKQTEYKKTHYFDCDPKNKNKPWKI
jgi:putative FmdB family regulatory protein